MEVLLQPRQQGFCGYSERGRLTIGVLPCFAWPVGVVGLAPDLGGRL